MNLKNKKIIIVSPHPDDETLGAGGFIKKLIEQNNQKSNKVFKISHFKLSRSFFLFNTSWNVRNNTFN